MLEMFGEILPLAVGVALSPLPIIAVLLLNSPQTPASPPAFLAGRLLSVIVIVAFCAVVIDVAVEEGETAPFVSVIRILVGIALVVLAATKWRKRPGKNADVELPRWMAMVDGAGPARSFGLALLLSVTNLKELLVRHRCRCDDRSGEPRPRGRSGRRRILRPDRHAPPWRFRSSRCSSHPSGCARGLSSRVTGWCATTA